MRIALVADAYPPARTSAAVQIRDLALEMAASGHRPTVIVPSALRKTWHLEEHEGVEVLRINAPRTKDIGRVRRGFAEFMLPFAMMRGLSKSPLATVRWDGIVWYSPTIFLGPFVSKLKRGNASRGYLILRDLFPNWAADTGLMSRGPAYTLFKLVEAYQYSVADVIGVQTPANLPHLKKWNNGSGRRVEVLNNWLARTDNVGCRISVAATSLADRTIFVYAGNMGAAQGMDALVQLASRMRGRRDVGFLFVGRGSEVSRLRADAARLCLDNVEFHDEIEPSEVPGLLAQCHVGLVSLDTRHTTHNVPGKFITYLQAGLPVLARINPGNDLEALIRNERVGYVCTDDPVERLQALAEILIANDSDRELMSMRAKALAGRMFSVAAAAEQIVNVFNEPFPDKVPQVSR